ncbi:MAG: hypothetical protein IJ666_03390 [Ruminococcus sp.]|nr:hypothetical protein [Ruminococcus sp.]
MIYDGTNRIYIIGEQNSGRKALVCSIIHKFMYSPVFIDGNRWELSAMDKGEEILGDTELLQNKMASFDRIKIFDLENILSDEKKHIPDFVELGLIINDEICGRIHFTNITEEQKDYIQLKSYAFSVILVVVECSAVINNDRAYMERVCEKLKKAFDTSNEKPRVVFALTKADILSDEMRSRDFEEFYRLFEKNAEPLVQYCLKNAIVFEKRAVSAFSQNKSDIFDENGEILKEPNFSPWEVDRLLLDTVTLALPLMRMRLENIIDNCNDTIRRRRGVFNRENIRAQLDVRIARKNLCSAIKNMYPLANAAKYMEK